MDEAVLFGGVLFDRYLRLDGALERGMDAQITGEWRQVGACALNVAAALRNFGLVGHVVSYVGSDTADEILEYMRAFSLSTRCVLPKDEPSGYCVTLLEPGGERTFLTQKGVEQVCDDALLDKTPEARNVYVSGYYLIDHSAQSPLMHHLRRRKTSGAVIVFDPGPLVGRLSPGVIDEMARIADVIAANEREAEALSKRVALTEWAKADGRVLICKRGHSGGVCYFPGGSHAFGALRAEVRDTSGAGDAFLGGFMAGRMRGESLMTCVDWGRAGAALTVETDKPHAAFTPADIQNRLNASKEF